MKSRRNSRHQRSGSPKKGGGGGKGTWGCPGDELSAISTCNDPKDPNYDEDDSAGKLVSWELLEPPFPRKTIILIAREFFLNFDVSDTCETLAAGRFMGQFDETISTLISLSFDYSPDVREATSQLLVALCAKSRNDLSGSFTILLNIVDEMKYDVPYVETHLAKFIARSIADDCLAPAFVNEKEDLSNSHKNVIKKSREILSLPHAMARLDCVWGVSGGWAPIKVLMKKIELLLDEFASSNEHDEAMRCLKELNTPHFHHEFVFQLIYRCLNKNKNTTALRKLLWNCCNSVIVSPKMIEIGFQRVFNCLEDIELDVPNARKELSKFFKICVANGSIMNTSTMIGSNRGRKRFFSRGDGGLIKA